MQSITPTETMLPADETTGDKFAQASWHSALVFKIVILLKYEIASWNLPTIKAP